MNNADQKLKCRYCNTNTVEYFATTEDFHYNNVGKWNTYRCTICQHIFQLPVSSDEELSKYYADDYYSFQLNMPKFSGSFIKSPHLFPKMCFLKRKRNFHHLNVSGNFFFSLLYKYIFAKPLYFNDPKFIPGGRILDYGTGAGNMVAFFNFLGWDAEGIEISPSAVENAKKNGLKLRCGSIEQLDEYLNYYDVIYSCHALEHVSNVDLLFQRFFNALKPGGKLVFEVPNGNSASINTYKDIYFYFGMPIHINLFTPISAKKILTKSGFFNIKTDSYSIWKFQVWSYYTSYYYKKKKIKLNFNSHPKIKVYLGYPLTLLTYLKSLGKDKGDNLIVEATKPL